MHDARNTVLRVCEEVDAEAVEEHASSEDRNQQCDEEVQQHAAGLLTLSTRQSC